MNVLKRFTRSVGILAALAMIASGVGRAGIIFEETFQLSTLGPSLNLPAGDRYSQRADGDYLFIQALPTDWSPTVSNGYLAGVFAFQWGAQNDIAVLLNEGGHSISRTITGLTVGNTYLLSFEYWGDNRPAPYSFDVELGGSTTSFADTGVSAANGSFHAVSIPFVASAASTTLRFAETSATEASPIIDNIQLSDVPEPSTLLLFGGSMIGLAAFRRLRRPQA